jgi:iron complex transport system ATP-binding protein
MLELKALSHRIGPEQLLAGISLQACPGELVAILGPNGAGKSTLMRLVSGEWEAGAGQLFWQNEDLTGLSAVRLAKERAVLTQKGQMSHDFPVREVVLMGRYPHFKHRPRPEDWVVVDHCLTRTETAAFAPRSYQRLSGGEQQRVQFARALAQVAQAGGPFLLLLDEPLNNLDPRHQHALMAEARRFARQGHVVLLVMHDLTLAARFADQVLLLKQGQQQAFGPPERVLNSERLSDTYDFPVQVLRHPGQHFPVIFFGEPSPAPATLTYQSQAS